jgi:hypothetical protein
MLQRYLLIWLTLLCGIAAFWSKSGWEWDPFRLSSEDDLVLKSQRYLAAGMNYKIALKGGGVSAMPSMHMATATVLILAAWRTRWLPLAVMFWLLTFFGSVYLGYHYAIDAPVAAAVAVLCWMVARWIYESRSVRSDDTAL